MQMLTLETVSVSKAETAAADPYRDAVEAALAAYRDAARGVSPDPVAGALFGEGLEREATEIAVILAVAKQRAIGGRLRPILVRPFWETEPTEAARRGKVRAVLRLLAEPNNTACEEKDLTTAINRLLSSGYTECFAEALVSFEQEPRLRTVPALVEAVRASDAYSAASALESMRGVLFTSPFLIVWYWATPHLALNVVGVLVAPSALAIITLVTVWTRSKRRSKSCAPLLRMLEDVEITDPKTRRWALHPIRLLAKNASAQPQSIRKHAQRLTRRRWELSGAFLPISASEPTPSAEELPIPSTATEADAGGTT